MKLKKTSLFLVLILTAIIILLNFRFKPSVNIGFDVLGYYLYLPATFVYHDIPLHDLTWFQNANELYKMTPSFYQISETNTGGHIIIYQIGMAILYLPFFLIGHIIASFADYPQDGFSLPYQYSIWIGGMIYSFLGLIILRKVLLNFFTDRLTSLVIIIIVLGTNYLINTTMHASNLMTANFIFTLYALFILLTIKWHEKNKLGLLLLISLIGSLMFLARPIELIAFAIPIFWNIKNKEDVFKLWNLIKRKKSQFVLASLLFLIVISIQLIYNKLASGDFFYIGYKYHGEDAFYLFDPNLFKLLFSFRKGWLIYTPIMIFALLGIIKLRKYNKNIFIPILIFTAIYLYAASCWSNWWYAASFGQRSLIQIYPILAIPIGYFILSFKRKNKLYKMILSFLILAFISLNLFQSWQYTNNIIDISRMTWPYYKAVFCKTKATLEDRKLLLFDRHEFMSKMPIDTSKYKIAKTIKPKLKKSNSQIKSNLELHDSLIITDEFYELLNVPITEITEDEYAIVQTSIEILPLDTFNNDKLFIVVHQLHKDKKQSYRTLDLASEELYFDRWNYRKFNYITPEFKSKKDKFITYIYNPDKKKFYVNNVEIKIYEQIK